MTDSARDRAIKAPAFGATVVSQFASVDNPHKTGLFVRVIRRRGRMNGGTWWQITDGRGDFWELRPDMCEVVPGYPEVLRALAGEAGAPDTPPADDVPAVWWSPSERKVFGLIPMRMEEVYTRELPSDAVRLVPATGPIPPRVQVAWVDHDEEDGDLHETGWIMAVEGETAVINCDCGPRTVRRPLSALTLGRLVPAAAPAE